MSKRSTLDLIYVATGYNGLDISDDAVMSCIPDRFIQLLLDGHGLFDVDLDDSVEKSNKSKVQSLTFSPRPIVYNATSGKHWSSLTYSTLHQTTRSKELIQLFHNAGHAIYENVLQIDNTLAESTLKSMNMGNIPPNLVCNSFIHFICYNININDSNLDGKDSLHATQAAA